jgi:hypothetical protein
MPSFYPIDNKRGLLDQKKLLPVIKEFFNKDIKEIENKYSAFDYECDDCYYELKTRTNTKDKYPTTLIGVNKLDTKKDLILIFKYTDCLTYINYDKTLFDTFEIKKFDRNAKASNKSDYIYIPVEHLKIIENYNEIKSI